jgi:hypothetical protein
MNKYSLCFGGNQNRMHQKSPGRAKQNSAQERSPQPQAGVLSTIPGRRFCRDLEYVLDSRGIGNVAE